MGISNHKSNCFWDQGNLHHCIWSRVKTLHGRSLHDLDDSLGTLQISGEPDFPPVLTTSHGWGFYRFFKAPQCGSSGWLDYFLGFLSPKYWRILWPSVLQHSHAVRMMLLDLFGSMGSKITWVHPKLHDACIGVVSDKAPRWYKCSINQVVPTLPPPRKDLINMV